MTTKKDAASTWSVRPIHPLMKTTSNPYSETTERKTAFSQDWPRSTGYSDSFLFFGLFIAVHADTSADQQAFFLYHIALPDSASIVSYNKEKL